MSRRLGTSQRSSGLRRHLRAEDVATTASRHEEVHQSVRSLHSFVELVDRVRTERLRALCLLVILNLGDVGTTVWFLGRGGREANPMVAPIVDRWWLLVLVKAAVLVTLSKGVLAAPARSTSARRLVAVAVVYYSVVVVWNLRVVGRL